MPADLTPAVVDGRRGFIRPLPDGTPLFYGPIGPQDRHRLRQGLRELSPASRYLRFLAPVDPADEALIERLTCPDQVNHIAWGVLNIAEPGLPGVALGRMAREPQQPASAEIALAVLDRYHGLGIGRTLLAVLCVLARRTSITELTGWCLPQNHRMVKWFQRLGARIDRQPHEWHLRLPVPTPAGPAEAEATPLRQLMHQVEQALR